MTGQFYFTLLNPAIALVLASTFFVLWRKRPARRHLLALAGAFVCSGLAFVFEDFLQPFEGPVLRIVVNGLFFAAVLAACCSAIGRVGAAIPIRTFAAISVACAALFLWYLFVDPSVTARVYAVNAAYAAFAVIAIVLLVRADPRSSIDRLSVVLLAFLFLLAAARPLATMMHALDVNAGGPIQDSAYWATVQALTPILAVATALVFLLALALELLGELRNEADRDYLTGLYNRRGFDQRAAQALAESEPVVWQPAIMLIDIDNFKAINDSFGHAVGDEVIAVVAKVLELYGGTPLVGRTGGEEYALYFADKRRTDLLVLAETLRAALGRTRISSLSPDHNVTVSIGIHTRQQTESLSQMMARADQALYTAKSSGKDRAAIAPVPLRTVIDRPASATR